MTQTMFRNTLLIFTIWIWLFLHLVWFLLSFRWLNRPLFGLISPYFFLPYRYGQFHLYFFFSAGEKRAHIQITRGWDGDRSANRPWRGALRFSRRMRGEKANSTASGRSRAVERKRLDLLDGDGAEQRGNRVGRARQGGDATRDGYFCFDADQLVDISLAPIGTIGREFRFSDYAFIFAFRNSIFFVCIHQVCCYSWPFSFFMKCIALDQKTRLNC